MKPSYLFIICLDLGLKTSIDRMKGNGFKLAKKQVKPCINNYNDIAPLANTSSQVKTLLHGRERAAAGIGVHVNADKTEYMCFNQRGNISTQNGSSLKLMGKFTYQGNNASSTEKNINTQLAKACTAIDRLSVIWKSDLTDKMKRSFLKAAVVSILLYGRTAWTLTKCMKKKRVGN